MVAVALSPNARALIQSGRNVHRPTPADRRRVGAALRERLGPTVLPAETPIRDLLLSMGWQLPSGTALGLCLVGGALFLALRPAAVAGPALPTRSSPSIAATTSSEPLVPAAPDSLPVIATIELPPSRATTTTSAQATPDPLGQEVQLLSRAMGQLRSGRAAEALAVLDEHQARFPNGALSQERSAMKARALCKLQRFREGRLELARVPTESLAYKRVLESCDASPDANNH